VLRRRASEAPRYPFAMDTDSEQQAPAPPPPLVWQEPAPIPPAPPGDPPTALAIVLLCSGCALWAAVAFALRWRRLRAARAAKAEAKARDRKALALETLERHGGPTKCSPTRSGSRYHQRKSDPAMLAVNNTRWQRTTKPRCGRGDLRRNPRSRAQQANMGRDRRVSS
jgi:hypothetical protein